MLELVLDIGADALRDTLYLVPFLLVTYLLLETLEHKAGAHTERLVQKAGHFGSRPLPPSWAQCLNAGFPLQAPRCFPAAPSRWARCLPCFFQHLTKCCRCSLPSKLTVP